MSLFALLVLLGIFIAIQPMPIISFIVVLNSAARTRAGWAFLAGWTGSLIAVVAVAAIIVVVAAGGAGFSGGSTPGKAICAAQLLLGLFLIVVGVRRLRYGAPPPSGPPKFLARLTALSLPVAALIGALVQPWTLLIIGDLIVLSADLHQAAELVAIGLFCLIASAGMLGMQTFAVAAPERAAARLGALQGWIETHQSVAATWLAIVIGGWLAIHGIAGLR
jgi:hypothetical protein